MRRLALLLLAATLAACTAATGEPRRLGRYADAPDGAIVVAWPASGVEGRFRARTITARIEDNGDALMDVSIDGVVTQLPLDPGVHDYTLFSASMPEQHVIRLTRRSEVWTGQTTIHAVTTDGAWLPIEPRAHRILFIGDSITVGYGNEGPDETCSYTPETSAPWRSYAAQVADAFDADFHVIAISGRGAARNYDGGEGVLMPALIDAALPDQPESAWDHARFPPELIVVNLGANDFSTTGPGEAFTPAYVALLTTLRARFPDAHIVSAFGPEDKQPAIDTISAAVAQFNAADSKDAAFLYLPLASEGRIYGCDWHPGADTHRVMARTLAARIASDLGWSYRPIP